MLANFYIPRHEPCRHERCRTQNHLQSVTPKCPPFLKEKRWKNGKLWEHLPKRYYFWTIINQKWKKAGHFGVGHFGVMDCKGSNVVQCTTSVYKF